MKTEDVHASHVMECNDWGDDRHCIMSCKICHYQHCDLCQFGSGMDDDELKDPCIGYPWTDSVYIEGRHVGRRSGTGWPK